MSKEKNTIEIMLTEQEALARITELRARGLPASNIYVFSDNPDDADKLTAETDVTYKPSNGSTKEKFTALFSSDKPEEKVLNKFTDLDDEEKEKYAAALRDGKILLYADTAG